MTSEIVEEDPRGTLLVFGAGANQVPVIEACRRRGWQTIAIDRDADAPGATLADRFVCRSLRETDRIREAIADERIAGVVARVTDHGAVEAAARLARERGLRGPCPRLVEAATHKRRLAAHCARAGVATPRRLDFEATLDPQSFPVIVRPDVTVSGKAGIRRVLRSQGLAEAVAEAGDRSANGRVDVSTWLDGADVSVLVHFDSGRALPLVRWDEWVALDEGGGIHGLGVAMPSIVEGDTAACASIEDCLSRLAGAFPESRSLVVVSLRVDDASRAHVIEIHLGLGGDGIAEQLLPAALPGWDALASWVDDATGNGIVGPPVVIRPSALLRGDSGWQLVSAPDAGTLRARAREALAPGWLAPVALREEGAV